MSEPCLDILGVRISAPLSKLRKKFGYDADYVPFACYDGYRTPAERAGNPNALELEDLLITVAMNSRIGANATWGFWHGIAHGSDWFNRANALLAQLPLSLDLADTTDAQVDDLLALFDALDSVSGVGDAVAGKVLCRKRPGLAPMLDSRVLPIACHLALEAAGVTAFDNMKWSNWSDKARAIMHFRMMCREGREQLDALCRAFALLPGNPVLSPLRALESLLWWEVTQEPSCDDPALNRLVRIMGWNRSAVTEPDS